MIEGSHSVKSTPSFRYFYQLNKSVRFYVLGNQIKDLLNHVYDSTYLNRLFFETYNSSKIEGNNLSLEEAKVLYDSKFIPDNYSKDILEVINLADTIRDNLKITDLSMDLILNIHRSLTKGIIEDRYCGVLRDCEVCIEGSLHKPPSFDKVEYFLEHAIHRYNSSDRLVEDVIEFKYNLLTIHPFVDGNGRTSRVIMNALLEGLGYPRLVITDKHKSIYYKALQDAQVKYGPKMFINYGLILMKYTLMYLNDPKILI